MGSSETARIGRMGNFEVIIYTDAVLSFGMASCSNEELDSLDTSSQNAIGFNIITDAASRATIIDQSNLDKTDFNVYAYTNNGSAFMGVNDTDLGFGGVNIVNNQNSWQYANAADLRYWPAEELNFYAVNPTNTMPDNIRLFYGWMFSSDKQIITYTCVDEYGSTQSNPTPNIDVMYAIAKNQTKDTNGGKVKFNFKHILSQVSFQAKVEFASMEVNISQVLINNAKFAGTFTLPTDGNDATNANWDAKIAQDSDNKDALTFSAYKSNGSNIVVNKNHMGNNAADISLNKPMLVIPQKLISWSVKDDDKSIEQTNSKKRAYLCIKCSIKQNGQYIFGSETNNSELYIPFSADWQPGKRYIYTIIFGGGYDADGNKVLNPIEFDAEQTDWVNAEGNYDIKY